MPPGTSMVTPTRSPSSAASARVKPTTPNLLAQYAVAAGNARRPSVEATVTTRPRARSSAGSAARTTAAVPIRLTATTRSQASGSTSRMSPHASMPAAVTTASNRPYSSATARTAASASRAWARSTNRKATPSAGSCRSSTTGVPPSAATAATIAAPSPDVPPVTITVPSGSLGMSHCPSSSLFRASAPAVRARWRTLARLAPGLVDQPARRTAGDVRHDDGAPAPLGQRRSLRELADRVVAALRPHVRAQLAQDRAWVVLVEDRDGVDAAQRLQHGGAVGLRNERTAGALQAADGVVGVQAHDQAVTERSGRLDRVHVAGVQQVEAAAGSDDGAALHADARSERSRVA